MLDLHGFLDTHRAEHLYIRKPVELDGQAGIVLPQVGLSGGQVLPTKGFGLGVLLLREQKVNQAFE